jgi:YVTN family beta-propeller protein
VGKAINVPAGPQAIVITPNGLTAYVACDTAEMVTSIATATNKAGKPISTGGYQTHLAITPNGKTVYAVNAGALTFYDSTVTPIQTAAGTAGTLITVGYEANDIVITPNGRTAYVVNYYSNSVSTIDTATNKVSATISAGPFPLAIALMP